MEGWTPRMSGLVDRGAESRETRGGGGGIQIRVSRRS